MLAGFAGYDTPRAVFPYIVNIRGDSTGAVHGQVIALADEARGDSTGAVLSQGDMPVVVVSVAVGQTAQKTQDFPELPFAVFLRPFVSGCHLFGVRLWTTGLWTFLEDDFWKVSVFVASWFDNGYVLLQFTEAFWFRLQKTD